MIRRSRARSPQLKRTHAYATYLNEEESQRFESFLESSEYPSGAELIRNLIEDAIKEKENNKKD